MKVYYEYVKDISLISSNWIPYIVVTDENIGFWLQQNVYECILDASNEATLFRNFLMMSSSAQVISIKLHEGFNEEKVDEQLMLITEQLKKTNIIVKELNGWNIQEKFDPFGESAIFVDPDGMVYYHPDAYYSGEKPTCHISQFDKSFDFTRPHLICMNCNTFYCHRNIYLNKLHTSEYKAPCSYQCKETTFFAKHSKRLFNELAHENMLLEEPLDRVDSFNADTDYTAFLNGNLYNYIKGLTYEERKL